MEKTSSAFDLIAAVAVIAVVFVWPWLRGRRKNRRADTASAPLRPSSPPIPARITPQPIVSPSPVHTPSRPVSVPSRPIVVPHQEWWPIVTRQAKHVRLIAPTDAGKSVTAQAMLGELPGKLLIIDPLWTPGNWGGLPAVTVTPDGGYEPIADALAALLDEMKRRGAMLQHLSPGEDLPVDELIVLWDEIPDTITELSKRYNDVAGEVVRRIAQRGRHGKIKLIGMGQSDRVKAWGLEGYGDAAQNFADIYLMDKALELCPELLDRVERPAVLKWRGKNIPVDVSRLLAMAQRPIDPSRSYQFHGALLDEGGDLRLTDDELAMQRPPARRTTCTLDDVVAYLDEHPDASQRQTERALFGYTGGDAYQQVTKYWRAALLLRAESKETAL